MDYQYWLSELKSWLAANNVYQKKFAAMLGVSPNLVNLMLNEKMTPTLDLILAIEKLTNGAVSRLLLFPQDYTIVKERRGTIATYRLQNEIGQLEKQLKKVSE